MLLSKAPIQVYLDSSDYSDLSDPGRLDASKNLRDILHRLKEYSDNGLIEIRYSIVNVLESIHTNNQSRIHAVRRVQLMQDLCGNKVLLEPGRLFVAEALKLATSGNIDSQLTSYRNDSGDWLPEITFPKKELLGACTAGVMDSINESGLHRNEKRTIKKQFIKNGTLTLEGIQFILSQKGNPLIKTMNEYLPIPQKRDFERSMRDYLLNRISETNFVQQVKQGLSNIVFLTDFLVDNYSSAREMPTILRKPGNSSKEKISLMRNKFDEFREIGIDQGISNKEIESTIKRNFKGYFKNSRPSDLLIKWEENRGIFAAHGIEITDWVEHIVNSEIGQIPSFDCWGRLMEEYFLTNTKPLKNRRKIKPSDHADLLHSCYIPYVNIFSTDGYMTPMFSKIGKEYGTKVVPSLPKLIDQVETYIEKQEVL